MFTICIADINICIDNKYDYIENMCSEYITSASPDFMLSASTEEISAEASGENPDMGYCESLAIYRKIAEKIILKGGFLLHGVAAEYKNSGIVFLAKSGVGKSTHAALWEKLFPKDFVYVNGDKPLVRIINNRLYAYGTPWAGKENLHRNARTEIKKVCFINRAETNECVKTDKKDVLEPLMNQIYIPGSTDNFLSLLSLINDFIQKTEFYTINCNTDIKAAQTACEVIFNE